jgi:hypothetical protein
MHGISGTITGLQRGELTDRGPHTDVWTISRLEEGDRPKSGGKQDKSFPTLRHTIIRTMSFGDTDMVLEFL